MSVLLHLLKLPLNGGGEGGGAVYALNITYILIKKNKTFALLYICGTYLAHLKQNRSPKKKESSELCFLPMLPAVDPCLLCVLCNGLIGFVLLEVLVFLYSTCLYRLRCDRYLNRRIKHCIVWIRDKSREK